YYNYRGQSVLYFFFFQAEDGIRDFHVTGVQTCALPISPSRLVPGVHQENGEARAQRQDVEEYVSVTLLPDPLVSPRGELAQHPHFKLLVAEHRPQQVGALERRILHRRYPAVGDLPAHDDPEPAAFPRLGDRDPGDKLGRSRRQRLVDGHAQGAGEFVARHGPAHCAVTVAGNLAGEHRPAIPVEFGRRRCRYTSVVAEPVGEMAAKALVDVARLLLGGPDVETDGIQRLYGGSPHPRCPVRRPFPPRK